MYGKKILLGLVIALGLAYGVPEVSAEFEATEVVHFGPNEFGGNYDDDFKEGKKKINISYKVVNNNPMIVVKDKSKKKENQEVLKILLKSFEYKDNSFYIMQLKEINSGKYFYVVNAPIVRVPPSGEYAQNEDAWVLGREEDSDKWKIYINAKNFYSPLQNDIKLITVRYDNLKLSFRKRYSIHTYQLMWNADKNNFDYRDEGIRERNEFNSKLSYNTKYRPITIQRNKDEIYMDVNSIRTVYEDDNVWKFSVSYMGSYGESDVPLYKRDIMFEVNKNYEDVSYWDKQTREWKNITEFLGADTVRGFYGSLVDLSYRIKFGSAYPLKYGSHLPYFLNCYKGEENILK